MDTKYFIRAFAEFVANTEACERRAVADLTMTELSVVLCRAQYLKSCAEDKGFGACMTWQEWKLSI